MENSFTLYHEPDAARFTRPWSMRDCGFASPDDFKKADLMKFSCLSTVGSEKRGPPRLVIPGNLLSGGHGNATIQTAEPVQKTPLFRAFECKHDGTVYAQPEPRLSALITHLACPTCQALETPLFGFDLSFPPSLSLDEDH